MNKLTVTVTQDDIEHGVTRHCQKCPIARAVARELLPGMSVEVVAATVRITPVNRPAWHTPVALCESLPPRALTFIERFDAGKSVRPFTFQL